MILPRRWKRVNKEYEEFLLALLARASVAQIQRILKQLGLPFSKEALHEVRELVQEKLDFFRSQPLKSDWFVIFIDAYHAKIRSDSGKIEHLSLFVAVGIDLDGHKEILGYWIRKGKENKAFWIEVLQDLATRGVHRVLLFVTDDFKGLTGVIQSLFPDAHHQLCLVHLKRNLRRRFSSQAWKDVRRWFDRVLRARDIDERGAEEVRRHIYTTTGSPRGFFGNRVGWDRRLDLGGYFPSQEALEVNSGVPMQFLEEIAWGKIRIAGIFGRLRELGS